MMKTQDSVSLSHRDGESAEYVQRGEPPLTGIGGKVGGAVGGRRRRWADLIATVSEGSGGGVGGGGTLEERSSVGLLDRDDDGLHSYAIGGCCKSYEQAKKKLGIIDAPDIFRVVLKRFQSDKFGKLNKAVRFPEYLDLAPYMRRTTEKSLGYKLYYVVVHLDVMNAAFLFADLFPFRWFTVTLIGTGCRRLAAGNSGPAPDLDFSFSYFLSQPRSMEKESWHLQFKFVTFLPKFADGYGLYLIFNVAIVAKKKSKSDGSESSEENLSKRDLALQQAMDQITDAFGKGSIMWLGRAQAPRDVPVVSTGSFALDMALGIGGIPKGRIVEIYGPEASGKTTLALHVIAESQKNGGYCAFVDAEHALDPALAQSIGVKTDNLLFSQPDCGEQALSLIDTLIRSGSVDVVVVDSFSFLNSLIILEEYLVMKLEKLTFEDPVLFMYYTYDHYCFGNNLAVEVLSLLNYPLKCSQLQVAALVPKSELHGEMGDAHVALQARLMSQALRKLTHSLAMSQTILLFINQVRAKLTTFGGFGGPTEVTSGGNALKFYASVRLNIRRIAFVKKGEEIIGNEVSVKIVKNKHAPPFRTAQFELEFGKGICRESELINLGLKHKLVIKGGGAMYSFNGQNFRGKDAIKRFLIDNELVREELATKLRQMILSINDKDNKANSESDDPNDEVSEDSITSDTTDEELTASA
ncbi:hypothetical protein ZIOFF_044965 [Zingiber officinale]|uniref:Uncharacterized protein n=1 Tax=Zingiber officinale TaxID=94328 RepID=A0A8J5KRK3_ZINOF|nr:hypothetical protein ZIOFF_044965 [Zingiber officinale]